MKIPSDWLEFNLRGKLALLIESLVVMMVVVTGGITTMREEEALENELRKRGLAIASDLAKFAVRPLLSRDLATLRRFVNHTISQDYVLYTFILNPEGKVVMHSNLAEVGKTYTDKFNAAAVKFVKPGFIRISQKNEVHFDIFIPILVSDIRLGTVRLGYSHMAIKKEIETARRQVFLIGLVTSIIGGIVAYFLAAFISTPIKKITNALKEVTNGDPTVRLSIKRNDEIGALADSFNKMTEDLRNTTISKDYMDNIIGSMNDTLVVVNPDARIRSLNRATCDLLGYTEDELIGKKIDLIIDTEEEIFRDLAFPRRPGIVNHELFYNTKSGERIPMLFSAAMLINKEAEVLGAVCIARDITERIQAEKALQQSERKLRHLSSQLLRVEEQERRRLSLELHDELGQSLMVLKLKVNAIQRALGGDMEKLSEECNGVIGYINEITENVRRLSRDLSPSILEDLGLSAAIKRLVDTSGKHSHIEMSLEIEDLQGVFPMEGQIILYRIIQECLTNIAKHARATHVLIEITKRDHHVICRVEDNGMGFDVKDTSGQDPSSKGLGLTTLNERARMLGGSLTIWSRKGMGTRITLDVPMEEGERPS
ncbi:putative Histidine kinase [uncultured Desulfobacterium sp.]|uniref:Oxygen sensor histidine kinase NreB n=1 Tax=uncultured Desulfobacterium sp. TaxID=201089 RepID=A0A445MZI0_9BACT|nr:putative Histidine kinase [uncultured Desulfobacterium sp.]